MQKRALGRSGIAVAPIALGGNVFGWSADEANSFAVLDAFVASGFDLIDTADVYSVWVPGHTGGESESVIGRWLKARGGRDKVKIATKVGMQMPHAKGLSRAHILRSVDESLARLQTDHIDLYQAHADDADTPLEETLEAFAEVVKAGKVRAIGASNYKTPRLGEALKDSAAHGIPRYESLQPQYNLYDRADFEAGLQGLCEAEQVGVIPYYGLASGFLTGKYRSEADLAGKTRGLAVKKYLTPRGQQILAALDATAAELSATPAQVALAWLMQRPAITAPIASATSAAQWTELAKAAELKLPAEAIARLDATGAVQ